MQEGASYGDVKSSYKRISLILHPDKASGDRGAESAFKKLVAAYEYLGTPDGRAKLRRMSPEDLQRDFGGFGTYGDFAEEKDTSEDDCPPDCEIYASDVFDKKFPLMIALPIVICNGRFLYKKMKSSVSFLINKLCDRVA